MPMRPLLDADAGVFGPEDIAAVAAAFEDMLRHLRLTDRKDPAATMLARLTLEVAKRGERDRGRLREKIMKLMSG